VIAILIHAGVQLAGVEIPEHRTLEVVDELEPGCEDGARRVLSVGQARALVQAGHAEPVEADFSALAGLIDGWRCA